MGIRLTSESPFGGGAAEEIADGAALLGELDASGGTIADPTFTGTITGLPDAASDVLLPPVAGGAKTANYAMLADDRAVVFDTTTTTLTCTLPAPVAGLVLVIAQLDIAEGVVIARNGAEEINGAAASYNLDTARVVALWCDGTDWYPL